MHVVFAGTGAVEAMFAHDDDGDPDMTVCVCMCLYVSVSERCEFYVLPGSAGEDQRCRSVDRKGKGCRCSTFVI
jgi:hypothetical protein